EEYLKKYNDLAEKITSPDIFRAVEEILDAPETAWQVLKEKGLSKTVVEKLGKTEFFKEFIKKGKAFEALVNSKIKKIPPFSTLFKDYTHLTQIHLKGVNKSIIADDLFVKKVYDEIEEIEYFRAIISDSKLSKTSPWTPNQKSELINVFRDNPNKKFIEFEVRTELEKLPIDSPIKTKDKVRVYK
ncbi:hypothetical protein, partial [Ornithobacterium rhinotracheale]|uniref:hypothetical protein n=1 Tax=Ornithobacterium rhinotracheale TaxID=28251 RepID=UPI0039FBEBED